MCAVIIVMAMVMIPFAHFFRSVLIVENPLLGFVSAKSVQDTRQTMKRVSASAEVKLLFPHSFATNRVSCVYCILLFMGPCRWLA